MKSHARQCVEPRSCQIRGLLPCLLLVLAVVVTAPLVIADLVLATPTVGAETAALQKDLAYALEHSGKEREAEAVYRKLIAAGAADQEATVRFAWLLNRQHRYREALGILQTLPMPHPDNTVLRLQADVAKWAGAMTLAERLYLALLKRKPSDTAVRKEYALVLRSLDQAEQTIREYTILVRETPENVEYLMILGGLYERLGDQRRALSAYERAAQQRQDPHLLLKIARLNRWLDRPADAVRWYAWALMSGLRGKEADTARYELALALFDAGEPARSIETLSPLLAKRAPGSDVLLLAARVTMALGRPGDAADTLTRLAETRPLTAEEGTWRAGAYRQAGRHQEARRAYAELAQSAPSHEAAPLWEAVGDLSLASGDAESAVEAYRRVVDLMAGGESEKPEILRKMARAADLAGKMELAARSYISYAARRRDSVEAQLEAARFFAAHKQFDEAYVHYRRVEELRGTDDLQIEIVRVLMGAERFAEAEHYIREAMAKSEGRRQAALLFAKILHSQAKYHEEKAFLDEHLQRYPGDVEAMAQLAYACQELNRNLEAYLLFGKAIAGEAAESEALTYWQGMAALHRGDAGRAAEAFDTAQRLGIDPAKFDAARFELWRRTAGRIGASGASYGDSNDLEVTQGGLYGLFRPVKDLQARVDVIRSAVDQRATSFARTALYLTLGEAFVTPRLDLFGQIGLEFYDNLTHIHARDAQWTGRFRVRAHFLDTSFVGLEGFRDTFWTKHDQRDPRQFNRIIDLKALHPGFHMDGFKVIFNKVFHPVQHEWYVETGWAYAEDDNIQTFGYTHYQIPLVNQPKQGSWLAVKPNVYVEFFKDAKEAYFSPSHHVTLGFMGHGLQNWKRYRLEFEANPQLQITAGKVGFGVHTLLDFNMRLTDRLSAGVGAFSFYAGNDAYVLWRFTGHLEFLF